MSANFGDRGLLALRDVLSKGATIAATAGNAHRQMWADAMALCGYSTSVDVAAADQDTPDGITVHIQDAASATLRETVKIRLEDGKPDVAIVAVLQLPASVAVVGVCRSTTDCTRVCAAIKRKVDEHSADVGIMVGTFHTKPDVEGFNLIAPRRRPAVVIAQRTTFTDTRGMQQPQAKRHRKLSIEKTSPVCTLLYTPAGKPTPAPCAMMMPPTEEPCKVTLWSTYWGNHVSAYTAVGPVSVAFLDISEPEELPIAAYRPAIIEELDVPLKAVRSTCTYDVGNPEENVPVHTSGIQIANYTTLASAMTEAWTRSVDHEAIITATKAADVVKGREREMSPAVALPSLI